MLSSTKQSILAFLKHNPDTSTKHIIEYLGISKQATARHLNELQALKLIYKRGNPPKVYYSILLQDIDNETSIDLDLETEKIIQNRFLLITPQGNSIKGSEGFAIWCKQRGFNTRIKAQEYTKIIEKYDKYKDKNGLIDATDKVKNTFKKDCYLDALYYSEFSAYEIFGSTNIYTMLLYAKIAQNRSLMIDLLQTIKDTVLTVIIKEKIDAVGFIPPSVPRKIQLQKEFERFLNLPLPSITINKIQGDIIVAQKTLKNTHERIENSKQSFVVDDTRSFKNILLIDDFVGSGSSLNFTAQKIRSKIKNVSKVVGFAIAGTPNGVINSSPQFEVIKEV